MELRTRRTRPLLRDRTGDGARESSERRRHASRARQQALHSPTSDRARVPLGVPICGDWKSGVGRFGSSSSKDSRSTRTRPANWWMRSVVRTTASSTNCNRRRFRRLTSRRSGSRRAANARNRASALVCKSDARDPQRCMTRAIARPSSPIVASMEQACHAGGRGFGSRRSRSLHIAFRAVFR